MYLSTCIVWSLLVLAGAQDNAPVAGKDRSYGTNVKQPAPNTQFPQPLPTDNGAASNTPQSMNTPSTPATATGNGAASDTPQSMNAGKDGSSGTNVKQPAPKPQFPQPLPTDNGAASDAPQSSLPSTIMPQTNVFSSVAFDQNAQQKTPQIPLSESPTVVELEATTRPPIASSLNSFSSAILPIPSSALPQTQVLAFATPQTDSPESTIQPTAVPISTTQPTAIPTPGTPLAEPPASTIQPTAMPTPGTQPEEQPASTSLPTGIPSVIPTYAIQNQFTSEIPTPQSTNVPVKVIPKGTTVPIFVPPATTILQPTVFPTDFTSTTTTQAPDTPTHIQIIFNNSYSSTTANSANLTAYCDGLVLPIAVAARVSLYRITNVKAYSQPQTDFLVLRFMVQPSVATSSVVLQAFSTFPAVRARRYADNTVLNNDGSVSSAVDRLRYLVLTSPQQFQLIDQNDVVLTVDRNSNDKIFVSWTDGGPCPTDPCRSPDVCVCSLTGTLQCQRQTQPNLLLLLLLLLLIPLVILIVVIVVAFKRRSRPIAQEKTQKVEKRVVRADMLSYHEYIAREIDPAQPKIATISSHGTLNESALNTLHRSLGEHLTIAFNGSTFVDNAGISDNADNTSRDAILPKDD